jgi:hypothetical protein
MSNQKLIKITSPSELNKVLLGHFNKAIYVGCSEEYGVCKYYKTSISQFKQNVSEWDDVWCFIENDQYYFAETSKKSKLFRFGLTNQKHIRFNSANEYLDSLNSIKKDIDIPATIPSRQVKYTNVTTSTSKDIHTRKDDFKAMAEV